MVREIMNLPYTVGALVARKASQDHEDEIMSPLFGRKRDGLSSWRRQRKVGCLCAHGRSLAESRCPYKQRAGNGEEGSPSSTQVNSGGLRGSAGRKDKIGHDEVFLLWNAHLTNGFPKSYSTCPYFYSLCGE